MGNLFIRRPDLVADASQFFFLYCLFAMGQKQIISQATVQLWRKKLQPYRQQTSVSCYASAGSLAGLKAKGCCFFFKKCKESKGSAADRSLKTQRCSRPWIVRGFYKTGCCCSQPFPASDLKVIGCILKQRKGLTACHRLADVALFVVMDASGCFANCIIQQTLTPDMLTVQD